MNWKTIFLILFLASAAVGNASATEPLTTKPKAHSTEGGAFTLPGQKGLQLMNEAYAVVEVVAEIPSKIAKYKKIKIAATDEQQLMLELVLSDNGLEVAYVLDLGIINGYNMEVKMEWTDANYDMDADELVIWWNTSEGNSGIYSGYEMERKGVLILNINDMQDIVNFTYKDEYRGYSAAEDADTESEDFHGKMDENSIWDICSYGFDVKLKDGDLFLSNWNLEHEGESECNAIAYKEGKFTYDYSTGMYELVQ